MGLIFTWITLVFHRAWEATRVCGFKMLAVLDRRDHPALHALANLTHASAFPTRSALAHELIVLNDAARISSAHDAPTLVLNTTQGRGGRTASLATDKSTCMNARVGKRTK